mgnify:CR=1 FL=1
MHSLHSSIYFVINTKSLGFLVKGKPSLSKKVFTSFYNNKQERNKTKSGKKRKWVNFEEVDPSNAMAKSGIRACQSSRIDIMSLNKSYFQGFKPKKVNKSSNKNNLGINCNSPVWRDKPRCN